MLHTLTCPLALFACGALLMRHLAGVGMTQELVAVSAEEKEREGEREGGDPSGFCLETEAIHVIMENPLFVAVQMETYQNDCFRDFPMNGWGFKEQLSSHCTGEKELLYPSLAASVMLCFLVGGGRRPIFAFSCQPRLA